MPYPRSLIAALSDGLILLDSGMGTRLMVEAESWSTDSLALVNLSEPRLVWLMHRDDIDAGADGIVANTFRADRPTLERAGEASNFLAINRDGVQLARDAAGSDRFVIGSIAPISGRNFAAAYREQAEILVECGCDALMLETHDSEGAASALLALAELAPVVPILASLWAWPVDALGAARRLEDLGAAAVGTNCGDGLDDVLAATIKLAGSLHIPLIAKPSAGKPDQRPATPEQFALAVPKLVDAGARLIGGCCGTTAAHVAAMRREIALRRRS